jgi:outer membrane protein W
MNKTTLTTLALAALGLASAQAGSGYVSYGKAPKGPAPVEVPSLCECFNANTANVSVFAAAILPETATPDFDDSFGGGIALNYFFTENVGLEGSYSAFGTDSVVHQLSGSVILRLPIKSICLAPYALAGGSYHTDGVNQGTWHVGAGLDYRFASCVGIFADAQYNWAQDTTDYTTVRTGVRFGF